MNKTMFDINFLGDKLYHCNVKHIFGISSLQYLVTYWPTDILIYLKRDSIVFFFLYYLRQHHVTPMQLPFIDKEKQIVHSASIFFCIVNLKCPVTLCTGEAPT